MKNEEGGGESCMDSYRTAITAQCQDIDNCQVGREAVIMVCGVQISLLSVMLRNAGYSSACRNGTTVVHVHDHEVEMHGVGCREKQEINQV